MKAAIVEGIDNRGAHQLQWKQLRAGEKDHVNGIDILADDLKEEYTRGQILNIRPKKRLCETSTQVL